MGDSIAQFSSLVTSDLWISYWGVLKKHSESTCVSYFPFPPSSSIPSPSLRSFLPWVLYDVYESVVTWLYAQEWKLSGELTPAWGHLHPLVIFSVLLPTEPTTAAIVSVPVTILFYIYALKLLELLHEVGSYFNLYPLVDVFDENI